MHVAAALLVSYVVLNIAYQCMRTQKASSTRKLTKPTV